MKQASTTQAWTITRGQVRGRGEVRYRVDRMLPARDAVQVTATSAMGVEWPEEFGSRDFARLELVVPDAA